MCEHDSKPPHPFISSGRWAAAAMMWVISSGDVDAREDLRAVEFGHALAVTADVSGDGFRDVLITGKGVGETLGIVCWVAGGEEPALLALHRGAEGLGSSVGVIADENFDRIPEVVVGLPEADGGGALAVLCGANWMERRRIRARSVTELGQELVVVGDPGELRLLASAVSSEGDRVLLVFDSRDGSKLFEISGLGAGEPLEHRVRGGADFDADGTSDIVCGFPASNALEIGCVRVFSGRDGKVIATLEGSGSTFGSSVLVMAAWGDALTPAIAVSEPRKDGVGVVKIYRSGEASPAQLLDGCDYDSSRVLLFALDDVDGDGVGDLCATMPRGWVGGGPRGSVYFWSAKRRTLIGGGSFGGSTISFSLADAVLPLGKTSNGKHLQLWRGSGLLLVDAAQHCLQVSGDLLSELHFREAPHGFDERPLRR